MSDFLISLIARSDLPALGGPPGLLRPRPASRFEPVSGLETEVPGEAALAVTAPQPAASADGPNAGEQDTEVIHRRMVHTILPAPPPAPSQAQHHAPALPAVGDARSGRSAHSEAGDVGEPEITVHRASSDPSGQDNRPQQEALSARTDFSVPVPEFRPDRQPSRMFEPLQEPSSDLPDGETVLGRGAAVPNRPDVREFIPGGAEPPVIRIHIGRVDVRANVQAKSTPAARPKAGGSSLSLDDYLRQRNEGKR